MPVPARSDVQHYRGDSLSLQLVLWQDDRKTVPADLSEATVTAQVRSTIESTEIAAEFDVVITGNQLVLTLPPKKTRDLPLQAVYDIEIDWDGTDTDVQTVVSGSIATAPDVTRHAVV